MRRSLLLILALLCLSVAYAGGRAGVRTEWGVVAGVNYPMAKFDMGQSSASLKTNIGFTAGLHMGLRIVGLFGIQPELLYSYNKIKLTDEAQKFGAEIKCSTVQLPLLLSLKLGVVRLNAGPVFTLVDNPTYLDRKDEKVLFGRINPTVGAAVGVSVELFDRMIIDARVASGIKAMENCLSYSAAAEGEYIKTRMLNAQLKVGVLF